MLFHTRGSEKKKLEKNKRKYKFAIFNVDYSKHSWFFIYGYFLFFIRPIKAYFTLWRDIEYNITHNINNSAKLVQTEFDQRSEKSLAMLFPSKL